MVATHLDPRYENSKNPRPGAVRFKDVGLWYQSLSVYRRHNHKSSDNYR